MSDPRWRDADPRPRYRGGPEWPARPAAAAARRPRWGALPGVVGVCIVIGGTAFGALVTAVAGSEPGLALGFFLVASTACAVLAVRPRAVYLIIPVPALAYVVAAILVGQIVHQDGTSLTALAVGAAQWIASGFVAMIIATVIAIVTTAVRQLRSRRDPRYSAAQVRAGRSRHGPAGATRRAAPARPQQRGAELDVGAAATTAFLERHGEGRND